MKIATHCPCCDCPELVGSPAILMPFVVHRVFNWTPVTVMEDWRLDSIPNGTHYQGCRSLHCVFCGLCFCDIRFDDEEMRNLYCGYRERFYTSLREYYEPGYTARNEKLLQGYAHIPLVEEFLHPWVVSHPKILDWGGDTGINTPFRQTAKIHHVYDVSGKDVVSGAQKVACPQDEYDLIVCAQVMEHVPHPFNIMGNISMAMHNKTILYIETPCEDVSNKHHWHEHINCFTEKSLRVLLQRCGLHIIDLKVQTIESGDIFMIAARLTE